MNKTGIVIPSYNEAENVFLLVNKIFLFLPEALIFVVDDSSISENEKLKKSLLKISVQKRKQVTVLSRLKKSGRGSAVFAGFKEILKNKEIEYFFEMDADFAHDPKDFKNFFSAIKENNADVVVGSRYLKNSIIEKWPLWRLVLSKFYNKLINVWFGLSLSDYTNGFRLYKRNAVIFLAGIKLREKGFIALSENIYRIKENNFRIVEIPVIFTDRKYGKSSVNFKEYISALIGIIRIKLMPLERV